MARRAQGQRRKGGCIAGLVVVIVSALAIELAARVIARTFLVLERPPLGYNLMDDPVLHHVWVPNQNWNDSNRAIHYPLIVNSQSWLEDYDVSREKPPGTFRIFYLGDSSTQGVVAPPFKMVERVEKGLNDAYAGSGIRFEVINTGTSSYSFIQYYLLTKTKLLDYDPDLLVIDVDMTDVPNHAVYRLSLITDEDGTPVADPPAAMAMYVLTPEGHARIRHAFTLPRFLTDHSEFLHILDLALRKLSVARAERHLDTNANWLAHDWTPSIAAEVERSMDLLRATIRLGRRHGVKVMVTGVPFHGQYTGELSTRPHEVLERVSAEEGVPFLNSYEALKEEIAGTPASAYYWDTDPTHFGIAGNGIWAEAQLHFLLDPKNGLLPARPPRGAGAAKAPPPGP